MRKKILVVVNNVWPPPVVVTGISVIYECQKELSKLGWEVHILTSVGMWDKFAQKSQIDDLYNIASWHKNENNKYRIIFHTYSLAVLKNFPKLAFVINRLIPFIFVPKLYFKYHYDVVHEYTSTPVLLWRSWFFKKVLRKPKIFHTLIAQVPSLFGSFDWIKLRPPRINQVICASGAISYKILNVNYPRDLVSTLSLGVNDVQFSRKINVSSVRKKFNIPISKRVVLFLGPIEAHKGPELFAKSAVELKRISQFRPVFLFATYNSPGRIPYKDRKEEILKIFKPVKNQLVFMEGIHNVPDLIGMSDIVVFPQTTLDGATGHPVTLLEAMAAGKLVIASDVEGIPEVIKDHQTGFLFRNKDVSSLTKVLADCLENYRKYEYIKHHGQLLIKEQFAVSQIAGKLQYLYQIS